MLEMLQLQYFIEVVNVGSITEAARKIGIPQPSLSQTIRRLEKELGIELFNRKYHRIILNEYGKVFYSQVIKSFNALSDGLQQLDDMRGMTKLNIDLYVTEHRANTLDCLSQFMEKNPQIKFRIHHGNTYNVPSPFTIAITSNHDLGDEYERRLLLREPIQLAVSTNCQMSANDSVDINDLASESFITMHENSSLYRIMQDTLHSAGINPNISVYCADPQYTQRCLAMGLGIGFVPGVSWKNSLKNVKLININGIDIKRDLFIYWKRERYVPEGARLFVDYATDFFSKLAQQA